MKIFNYDGKRYFKKMFERLYQVCLFNSFVKINYKLSYWSAMVIYLFTYRLNGNQSLRTGSVTSVNLSNPLNHWNSARESRKVLIYLFKHLNLPLIVRKFCKLIMFLNDFDLSILGQGSAQKKAIAPNTIAKKPAAYQPPHAKHAAAIQAEVIQQLFYNLQWYQINNY